MPESLDKQLAIADVYARALFDLAQERGVVDDVRNEIDGLADLAGADPDFAAFLESAAIGEDERRDSIEKMFRGKLSDLSLDTLLVMNRHGRAGLIEALRRSFKLRSEAAANEVVVTATTAVEMSETERQAILQTAEKLSGKKPLTTFIVDPEILGGLILRIGDMRYDNSIRRKLRVAARLLAERGDRGLELGAVG